MTVRTEKIKINRTEDRKVTLSYEIKDANGSVVVILNAAIGTGQYDAGTLSKQVINKAEYFGNTAKYKPEEAEFETEYEAAAAEILGGPSDVVEK